MQYPLLSEYVSAITHANENLDQLKHLEVVQDEHGEPYRSSGAFAVVFKMRNPRTGQLYALKCFTEEQEGRAEAYRKIEEELEVAGTTYFTSMRYYERELFVDSSVSSESEFPVLLMDWVEGSTMELYIREHYRDSYAMEMLCYRFCRLAAYLRSQPFAHGDVKPDNIMVSDTGTLTLIDYDGMFVPSMQGESSPTLGTEEFRHPLRTPELFDATIDDFALASIALSLRAIALDSQLLDQYGAPDRLLFSASDYRDLAQSKVMQAIWRLVGDKDLCKFVGLFVLAHAEQSLASTSFQLFSTTRPEKPIVVPLSTEVTDEDLAEAYTDEYDVKFSPDRKRLLEAPRELVSYTIPDTVTVICDEAFDQCSRLTSLTIPDSVTTIGANPFRELTLQLDNRSPLFYVVDNVLFTADKSQLIAYCSTQTSYSIPTSVTSIGDNAFYKCSRLASLTIPNSVTSIGYGAFYKCSRLASLTIPNSVISIGHWAFEGCSSLTSLTIPNSVTSIGEWAFSRCLSLTSLTIPNSVTSIGNSAFEYCKSLTSLTIPNSVISIGDGAFSGCENLTLLMVPNSVTSIGDKAFSLCSSLISLTIPYSVTSMGKGALFGCDNLNQSTREELEDRFGDQIF
ncbi:leucine-rich repeat protein [uncultured Porphyromonas sp.]|uniref:leucine-rich repeat protein n=1 Tax=uncultured Porphyromonas sp. TaxID=159274 RepID=UPI00262FBDB8|nr:leucine-rich repeat protein [uncultured Porphyromonas sp.]